MDFVNIHEELYNKTTEHFKDKARKKCLWEAGSRKLSSESVQDFVQIPKNSLLKIQPVQVWPGPQGNERGAELNSGQI